MTGMSSLLVVGGSKADGVFAGTMQKVSPAPMRRQLTARRWAMVIECRRCSRRRKAAPGALRPATRLTMSRRSMTRAHEIKWIWKDSFETASPRRKTNIWPLRLKDKPVPGVLQPLRQPSLRPGLPDAGHLETGGWHRHDGLASLHRMPVLHGGLPVWFAQL